MQLRLVMSKRLDRAATETTNDMMVRPSVANLVKEAFQCPRWAAYSTALGVRFRTGPHSDKDLEVEEREEWNLLDYPCAISSYY